MHKLIRSSRTCESFNIDNYELRTHTNISGTKDVICKYNKMTGVKSSVFILDLSEKSLSNNIAYNNFRKLSECTLHSFVHNPKWNDSIAKLPQEHLYTKAGRYKGDSWIYVLDSVNQVLWAELVEDVNYKHED